MPTKVGTKYQTIVDVDPNAQMICGRTGINKKYSELTDDDIAKMIAKNSKFFVELPAAQSQPPKP